MQSVEGRREGLRRWEPWLTTIVAAIALAWAIAMAVAYYRNSAGLWVDVHHDRNGDLQFGLDLGLALRHFDFASFFAVLLKETTWPPVHSLALAVVTLLGGADHRLGILPSLAGWVATIVMSWLIALRLFQEPVQRLTAAATAALFIIASPAFRLLASDVMLEGLGAGISAFVVYAYIRALERPGDIRRLRGLGLSLTLLFFEKYNYWELLLAAAAVALLWERPGACFAWLRDLWRAIRPSSALLRSIARGILKDPLLLAFGVVVVLVIAIAERGPTALTLFGKAISLYPPENLTTLAYGLLFLRAALFWRRHRSVLAPRLGPAGLAIFHWHLAPVAIYFLIPKRLPAFLWYVGPNNSWPGQVYDPLAAAAFQWTGFAKAFHAAPWAAWLVLGLALIGITRLWRAPNGVRILIAFALISAAAVILHPQQQQRFQTTWLFAVWLLAGAGAATLLQLVVPRLQAAVASAAIGIVAVLLALAPGASLARTAAIRPPPDATSALVLSDAYLPFLDGIPAVGFAATFGRTPWVTWTLHERCRCLAPTDEPWLDAAATPEQARQIMAAWLASTKAEAIVSIDAGRWEQTLNARDIVAFVAAMDDALAQQSRFQRVLTLEVPAIPAKVSIWRRVEGDGSP